MTHRHHRVSHLPIPAHQFEDIEQEREANLLGMWVFLATEVLFFGGLFVAYAAYRRLYPAIFADASRHLDVVLASLNTAILLCSSLTMALAVHSVRVDKRNAMVFFLILTALLGSVFLGIKFTEYTHKFEAGLLPGANFRYEGPNPQVAALFFTFYYVMTGIHALHLLIGILLMGILAFFAWRGRYSSIRYMPVELSGLYWHFVDLVWIFLFPLLYLIDRA